MPGATGEECGAPRGPIVRTAARQSEEKSRRSGEKLVNPRHSAAAETARSGNDAYEPHHVEELRESAVERESDD